MAMLMTLSFENAEGAPASETVRKAFARVTGRSADVARAGESDESRPETVSLRELLYFVVMGEGAASSWSRVDDCFAKGTTSVVS